MSVFSLMHTPEPNTSTIVFGGGTFRGCLGDEGEAPNGVSVSRAHEGHSQRTPFGTRPSLNTKTCRSLNLGLPVWATMRNVWCLDASWSAALCSCYDNTGR